MLPSISAISTGTPATPPLSGQSLFFFLLLAACPTMQNLIPHLSQFFDDPSLGFGGFLDIPAGVLDNAEQRLNLGLQLGVFLQSLLQGHFAGNRTVLHFRKAFCHGFSLRWIYPY